MTNKYLWDIIIGLYLDGKSTSTQLQISSEYSSDNFFVCYLPIIHKTGMIGKVEFSIKVEHSFLGDNRYEIYNINELYKHEHFKMSEENLKKLLIPILREVKLDLIGI